MSDKGDADAPPGPPSRAERSRLEEREVRVTRTRDTAEEWALVLVAEGLEPAIRAGRTGFSVCVRASDAEAAAESLARYDVENPRPAAGPRAPAERIGDVDALVAAGAAAALLAFFAVTGPASRAVAWFEHGSADAARIRAGELWRAVTALTLHADLGHVIANALFGGLFLAAACSGFGPGLGLALTLLAGACGNLANAVLRGGDHLSIGASTAVFGAVGLLAGRALAQRVRTGGLGIRIWVPFAAGLALVAMLGVGAESDVWAHLFGFVAGLPIGAIATLAQPRAPGRAVQAAAVVGAIGAIWLCWERALRTL